MPACNYNAAANVTVPTVTNLSMSYAGLGQTERLTAGTVSFVNNRLGISSRTSSGATDSYTRSPDGTILGEKVGTSNYYYLVDALGSVIAVTNPTGATLKDSGGVNTFIYKYDPYGKPLNDPPTSFPSQPYRFAGYYWGSTYGLYKAGERYYDPTLGRWTQQDPIDNPLDEHGWNHYIYAGDDPVNFTDPAGTLPFAPGMQCSQPQYRNSTYCQRLLHPRGGIGIGHYFSCRARNTGWIGIGATLVGVLAAPAVGVPALVALGAVAISGGVSADAIARAKC